MRFKLPRAPLSVDLSAWIGGLTYVSGMALAGREAIEVNALPMALAYGLFLGFVLFAQRHMRIALSAASFGAPQALVTSGVFSYSRNPIYVAFLGPLLSIACASPVASAVAISAYIAAMSAWVISREEEDLEQAFGPAFASYRAATPRWI